MRRQDLLETAAWSHFGAIMGSSINDVVGGPADLVMPYTWYMVQFTADAAPCAEGAVAEAELYRPLGDLFEKPGALLCPTIGTTALAGGGGGRDDPRRGGEGANLERS